MSEQASTSRLISLDRYTLFASANNAAGRRARLVWSVRDGLIRATVFTNDPADSDPKQMISLPIDASVFGSLMDLVVRCARSKEETRFIADIFAPVRDDAKKIVDKSNIGQVLVGRDADGIVWMSLQVEGRPKVKCVFSPGNFVTFKKADGTEFAQNEASSLYAIGYTEMLRSTMNHLVAAGAQTYVPKSRDSNVPASGGQKKAATAPSGDFDDVPY